MPASADLIIAINGFYGRGGTERQIVDIAVAMQERGWKTTVLSRWPLDPNGENHAALWGASVEIIARPWEGVGFWRRVLNGARAAVARADESKLERDAWVWQSEQLARRASQRPVIIHEIPYFGRMPEPALNIHRELRLPVVHTILGTPRALVEPAAEWAVLTTDGNPRIAGERAAIWIPCTTTGRGSDHRRGRPACTEKLGLLFVGRVAHSKGLDLLLRAIESLDHVELTIVGDGPELEKCRAQATAFGSRVHFRGSLPRESVFDEIAKADVLVVPSRCEGIELQEGMPTVVTEALCGGCPVLASAVGGIRQVLGRADAPGWLVPPDDVPVLRSQIAALDAEEIAERAAAAPGVYRLLLQPSVVFAAYEKCYARALTQAPHDAPPLTMPD